MTAATYVILGVAILAEVVATTALARSDSFTKVWPSVITIVGYAVAFYGLSFPLRVMPTGIVYALWSGLGIVAITAIAWVWQGQRLDAPAILGIGLIIAGVVVINVFSGSLSH